MVLVDTNIIAGLLIESTPWFASARTLYERDPQWHSEVHALVELTSVLTRYVRVGEFDAQAAIQTMTFAQQRFADGLHLAAHAEALRTALEFGVSAYDARFLVLARELGTALVTEDAKLRRAAARLTQSIDQALDT